MKTTYDAIVIGAGHNGLVAAAYLARAGRRVAVFERRPMVGGAAGTEEIWPGYKVNLGASSAAGLDAAVVKDLGLSGSGLQLLRPNPSTLALMEDGGALPFTSDSARTAEAMGRFSSHDAAQWPAFVRQVEALARYLTRLNSRPAPKIPARGLADALALLPLGWNWRRMGKTDRIDLLRVLPMSMLEYMDEWFEADVVRGALSAAAVMGLRQGPMAAGTAFHFLHQHAGHPFPGILQPVWVRGGIGALSERLSKSVLRHGGEIHTGRAVARIRVASGRSVGVVLEGGEEVDARLILSNADPRTTFLKLVNPSAWDPRFVTRVQAIKYRGSAARVFLALDRAPRLRGTAESASSFLISPSLAYAEKAYDDVKHGQLSTHPILCVHVPSSLDPGRAPEGRHLMEVTVQYVPYRTGTESEQSALRQQVEDLAIHSLEAVFEGLGSSVVERKVWTPFDLEQQLGLPEGNGSHGEMMLDQILFLRPVPGWSQSRTPVAGLYLCGAGAHPGGGVTGQPGRLAARQALRDSPSLRTR